MQSISRFLDGINEIAVECPSRWRPPLPSSRHVDTTSESIHPALIRIQQYALAVGPCDRIRLPELPRQVQNRDDHGYSTDDFAEVAKRFEIHESCHRPTTIRQPHPMRD
ncbi:MAG: hypothetical protein GY725_15415 [bacterium]|nr:hypothetical protein [bacterium]